MTDSLRDQLLGLGFKPAPAPERKPEQKPASHPACKSEHAARSRHANPRGQRANPGPAQQRVGSQPSNAKRGNGSTHPESRPAGAKPRSREDIDLARAYAIRAQREKDERIEAERLKQEQARLRREAKAKLAGLLRGKALNDPSADIARHFEYGGKIKRIYVTQAQLSQLNRGELGVVQMDGRYVLVDAAMLAQAETVFAPAIALKVDPDATRDEDPYADPQYQVPDDLVW